MVRGRFISELSDLMEAFKIREAVFQCEQGVPAELEFDNRDGDAIHALAYDGDKAVAVGRLLAEADNYYHIGRIAVLKSERGRGFGDFIVRMLTDKAFELGADKVYAGAQLTALEFYRKIGFEVCGKEYMEAGMRHVPVSIDEKTFRSCTACHRAGKTD